MITSYKDLKSNTFYLSNNPCFPGQIFYVTKILPPEIRFSQEDCIVHYDRIAYSVVKNEWYRVCKEVSWAMYLFGIEVPSDRTKEIEHLV